MTAITITVSSDVLRRIDELRQLELLSRSAWLRREVVLAVRANDHIEAMETKGNG
jgi:predicted transcriptional regulator